MKNKIIKSLEKFNLNLNGKTVLTESATGNYVVTPIIAALAGAKVLAFTKNSRYGTVKEVYNQTYDLAKKLGVKNNIQIITDTSNINHENIDIVTNTGFLRPINDELIGKLSSNCVIPLMLEPWEYRAGDVDIESCIKKGIKVYGTNESDPRLMTMEYIGLIVLYFLLEQKFSPYSSNVLLIGNEEFTEPARKILKNNNYNFSEILNYYKKLDKTEIDKYNVIVLLEHKREQLLIGNSNNNAFINYNWINDEVFVLHIAGLVDFNNATFNFLPPKPAPFGYMSYTTDFIDNKAVIDLHTAGLKVAEGMIEANKLNLNDIYYKKYMENNFPALAFDNKKYW